jgi:hypothetical protein
MPFLLVPRRFAQQPQYVAPIDRQGLGKGVQLLFNPALGPVDLATSRIWVPNGTPNITTSPLGKVFSFDGGASDDAYTYTGYPEITGNVGTFFMWAPTVGAADTFGHIFLSNSTASANYFQVANDNTIFAFAQQSTGAISWFNSTNRSLVICSAGTAGSTKAYLDGADSGLTWSATPTSWASGSKDMSIGRYSGGVAWDFAGTMLVIGYTTRVWGATEARAFHESKGLALLKSPPRRLWVPASSGVSGTVSCTNANDTLAAAGTTTVTGTLAKTNANDTSAASGTTTVTGSLARTNANDTVSASGSVGSAVTGTLAYTNANDTSAASGTTTVIGSLAKTNSNDTLAASGTTTVTGSLAKTNANDTSAASGTTTIVGTLAKTNANDTVSASGTVTTGSTGTVAYTNQNDTLAASGTTTILGSLARTNANDSLSASGTVNNGIIVESALTDGVIATIRIKKPGIPTGTPDWLKTTLEIVLGRRGNRITPPPAQTLTFSATPTKAECEALYAHVNNVHSALTDLINRFDT